MLLIPSVLCCCQGVSKFKRTGLDKLTNNLILWVSSHSSLLLALHWFRWVVQIVILYPTGWKENNFSWKLQLWCTYILKNFTTVLQSIIKMFTKHSQETSFAHQANDGKNPLAQLVNYPEAPAIWQDFLCTVILPLPWPKIVYCYSHLVQLIKTPASIWISGKKSVDWIPVIHVLVKLYINSYKRS